MIKCFKLVGLFGHKRSEIPLSETLTVITGLNDSGKSSIFHGFRWFITNKPRGGRFLLDTVEEKVNKATFSVVTEFCEVSKTRTDTNKTYYNFNDEVFHKADFPDEIKDVLDILPSYKFGDIELELNFVFQLDAPFLISEAPALGAIVLSELAGTRPVEMASKSAREENNNLSNEIENIEFTIKTNNDLILKYENIPDILISYEELLTAVISAENKQETLIKLELIKSNLLKINKKILNLNSLIDVCLKAEENTIKLKTTKIGIDSIASLVLVKTKLEVNNNSKIKAEKSEKLLSTAYKNTAATIKKLKTNINLHDKLKSSIEVFNIISRTKNRARSYLEWTKDIKAFNILSKFSENENRLSLLINIDKKYKDNIKVLETCKKVEKAFKVVNNIKLTDIKRNIDLKHEYSRVFTEFKSIKQELIDLNSDLDTITNELNVSESKQKEFKDKHKLCPICKKPFEETCNVK